MEREGSLGGKRDMVIRQWSIILWRALVSPEVYVAFVIREYLSTWPLSLGKSNLKWGGAMDSGPVLFGQSS